MIPDIMGVIIKKRFCKIALYLVPILILCSALNAAPEDVSVIIEPMFEEVEGDDNLVKVTIINKDEHGDYFSVTLESAKEWATYRAAPLNPVFIGGQSSKTIYLNIIPLDGVNNGQRNVTVLVESDHAVIKKTRFRTYSMHYPVTPEQRQALHFFFVVSFGFFVIVAGIILMHKNDNKTKRFIK